MKTNELKKGTRILLRNGWEADIMDNLKGNTRLAKVYGYETEIGSVYAHDIVAYKEELSLGEWKYDIEYTPNQLRCKQMVNSMF